MFSGDIDRDQFARVNPVVDFLDGYAETPSHIGGGQFFLFRFAHVKISKLACV